MKLFLLLFMMSSFSSHASSLLQQKFFSQNIAYEATIFTKDGESKSGFLTDLDDSTITISQTMKTSPSINTIKYHYGNIEKIKLTRLHGSRAGNGLWKGLLIGATTGGLIGLISGDDRPGFLAFSAGDKAGIFGFLFGLGGLIIGCIVGAFFKKKYKFNIDGDAENFASMVAHMK